MWPASEDATLSEFLQKSLIVHALKRSVSKHSGISHRENRLWFLWPPGHNV